MKQEACVKIQESTYTVSLDKNEMKRFLIVCDTSDKRDVTIELTGEGASANVCGLFIGKNEQEQSLSVTVRHLAPHTTSHIEIVGALKDKATASITGTIEIAPGAFRSEGREEIRTLLLSKRTHVRAIPELKIGNNDVKCSHAVSTTHIEEEKKFYLESRGMSEEEAVQTVLEGHFASIVGQIPNESLRKKVQQNILR